LCCLIQLNTVFIIKKFTVLYSVVDSHQFDVDPDANPDADTVYQNDADPDADPDLQQWFYS